MEKIKNMMLTKVLAIVLTVLIMFSAISSLFVINANATSEDSKTTVYFMSNLSEPTTTIYMYNWCGEDNNFVTGEKVASEKKVESSDDSKIFNLWKFTVANKIDGAIFTTDDKWKDDDDDYNNSIKLTGNVMNKDNNTVLFFEQDGKSDLSEKKFTEYSAVKATLVTKEINALYDNEVELVDISALSPQGTFADYKVTYTLYNGDTELVSGDKGILKYKFDKKDFKDSKVTLTLKAKDIAGNVEDCGNITVNLIDEGSFKFEKDEDTKSYDENGIELQKIDNFNDVDYSVVYDKDADKADKTDDFAKIEDGKLKIDSEKGKVGVFTIKATATAYGKDLSASYKLTVTKADKEGWKYDDGKTDDVKFGASYSIVPPIEGVTDFSCNLTMDSGNIDEHVNLDGNVLSFKKYTDEPIKVEVTFNGDKFYNSATATYTVRCVLDNFEDLDNINITSEGVVEEGKNDYNKDVTISSNDYTFLDYDSNINEPLSKISEDWKDSVTLNKNIENPTFLVKGKNGVIYKYQSNIRIDKNSPNGKIELQSSSAVWDKLFIGKFDFNNFIQTLNSNSKEPLYVTANDDAEGVNFNSGLAKVQYYVVETDPEKQLKREDLDRIKEGWKDAEKKDDHYEVSAPVNKTSVIYVKIADNFNNVTYISTNGLVSETIAPTCDVNVTNNEELYKIFGYYNQDVNVNVTNIKDTGDLQSGVKSVSITAKDKDGNDIQIKDNTVTSGFENDLTFTIPIENLEKQEISYDVTVTDNCNNLLVVSKKATVCGINKFKIDLNGYEDNVDTVYKQDKAKANVTFVTRGDENYSNEDISGELEKLINPDTDTNDLKITIDGIKDIVWNKDSSGNGCYTATVFLTSKENKYDLSSLKNSTVKSSKLPKYLVFDTTAPTVKISYDNNDVKYEKYFNAERTATVTVDDKNFVGAEGMITVVATDPNGKVSYPTVTWVNKSKATLECKKDAHYKIKIEDTFVDLAGNKAKIQTNDDSLFDFIIDKTAPKVTISYDNNDVKNEKYFNVARTATVTVTDSNFKGASDMVTITKKRGKGEVPKISWDGNIGTVKFVDEGEYGFAINKDKLMDLAGNKVDSITYSGRATNTFVIDKTKPYIGISYDDKDDPINDKYFREARKGTVKVNDDNFKIESGMITIEATDKNGKKLASPKVKIIDAKNATFTCAADAYYKVVVDKNKIYDLAGNKGQIQTMNDSPFNFVVDKTVPTASIVVKDSAGNTVGKEKKSYSSKIKFNNYSNKTSKATLTFEDNITKNKNLIVKYYVSENPVSIKTLTGLKENKWKKYTKAISFSPDKKFVVYAKVTDTAGNTKYISSDGIILDKTKPNIDGIAPNIKLDTTSNTPKKSIHGYNVFSGDVVVDYKISDPIKNNTCSGIDMGELSYEIRKDNTVSQSGKLSSLSGKITVLASKNNSNNVTLTVTAKDKAGNVSKKVANLKIDITRPQITVSYRNNSALNDKMFKDNRTATITVYERNFDPNKVNVTVTADGSNYPVSLNWTDGKNAGTDSYEHTATVLFSDNKDYTFDVNCSDEVGNESSGVNYGDSVAPTSFTVDKIAPQVTVSYDNNNAQNDNYYNQERTATITINEHNFNENDVKWNVTSTGDNSPSLSSWSNSGDTHTATITYSDDAKYNFTIDYTDMAGNKCNTVPSDEFYVDKTAPKISISGVDYHSANRDNVVGFTLSANDENIDSTTFENDIELVQINGKNKNITSTDNITVVDNATLTYTVNNLDSDGVYAIKCNVKDKAGNSTDEISVTDEKGKSINKKVVEFSVNRNGSTFILDKNTKKVVNKGYVQNVDNDVEITEINPNRIKDITLQLEKDNVKRELKENQDYTVKKDFSDTSWNTCKYTIKSSCFKNEGSYVLSLKTTDKAGNPSYNETDNPPYSNEDIAKVNFVVDKTCPSILVSNLQSNGRYNTDKQKVNIIADDNTSISKLQVFLNGKLFKEYSQKEIAKNKGKFTLEINSSDDLQSLKVVGVDLAGNSTDDKGNKKIEYKNFLVTTNFWIQYINNTVALVVTAIVVLLIAGAVAFIIVKKRKK